MKTVDDLHRFWTSMSAIFGFTFHIGRMTKVLTPDIYRAHWLRTASFFYLSRFSTWRICSREQRKKQLDWLVTNTDDITSQSHSVFACSREQIRQVENWL